MKILWVKTDFLHPTNRGGQIRTLEMLKWLRQRHEIHYVTFDNGHNPEGRERCLEYCSSFTTVPHAIPSRRSPRFAGQLLRGLISPVPVSVQRYTSARMKAELRRLLATEQFDSLVCDFLFPALNIPDIGRAILFQHNVESVIWKRMAEQAKGRARASYLGLQAKHMRRFERSTCRRAGRVIAVSEVDELTMQRKFGVENINSVRTGVDLEYFAPPPSHDWIADLVFVGSMDWMPNIDGVDFFLEQVFPLIRNVRPQCRLVIAGRKPSARLIDVGRRDRNIVITGTVDDVRPFLWGSDVSIVPLRVGGGTRLKIFEAMAARVPVVSTSVGAEGLPIISGQHLTLADAPQTFAYHCLELLADAEARKWLSSQAWQLVSEQFSWGAVTEDFEQLLRFGPRPN